MTQPGEQRNHLRFEIPGLAAYAVLKRGWPRSPVIGDISDICVGGLSFCYPSTESRTHRLSHLNILLTDGSFQLNTVQFEVIWDCRSESEVFAGVPTRRCGVRFLGLTDEQKSDLRYFIQFHTTADPEA